MSRFRNEVAHLQAHIKTLRLGAGALRGGVLAGWASTPRAAQIAALIELAAGLGVALLAGGLLLRAI